MLNGIMWGAFELFPVAVTESEALSAEYRALDGLFQALGILAPDTSARKHSDPAMKLFVAVGSASWLLTSCLKGYLFSIVSASSDNPTCDLC